jgi:hypothetical protein
MYPEEMVLPMRAELAEVGFQELYTAADVENAIKEEGTTQLLPMDAPVIFKRISLGRTSLPFILK